MTRRRRKIALWAAVMGGEAAVELVREWCNRRRWSRRPQKRPSGVRHYRRTCVGWYICGR